jgi:hypothetical protein
MNTLAYFEIQSSNPAKTAEFYTAIFGWQCTEDTTMPIPYWRIKTDSINGAILQRPAAQPAPEQGTNAFTCSFQVENFDAMAATILAQGGTVAMPKFPVPGTCWQGYFLDPEGNVFGLFEVDETIPNY